MIVCLLFACAVMNLQPVQGVVWISFHCFDVNFLLKSFKFLPTLELSEVILKLYKIRRQNM